MVEAEKDRLIYDYLIAILVFGDKETVIGGAEKIINKVIKGKNSPNLSVKGIDIFYRDMPVGTLAADIKQNIFGAERIQPIADKLYSNLLSDDTRKSRIAETRNDLDTLFRTDRSQAVRILAKTVYKWYDEATETYMDGYRRKATVAPVPIRTGIPLKQDKRAALGEQFYSDIAVLLRDMFTAFKPTNSTQKKKSPQATVAPQDEDNGDIIIVRSSDEIAGLLEEYSACLAKKKVYFICCKNCRRFFTARACNTLYCEECKTLRKKNAQTVHKDKRDRDELWSERQRIRESFENFIFKKQLYKMLSEKEQAAYRKLHKAFMDYTGRMLKRHDKAPNDAEIRKDLKQYFRLKDTERCELEDKYRKKYADKV